ncbi:primosomal protein N' [bacterium BMS3Bbin06]|nr:primosomal protein N' [bacterium BMS3Abin08]GBE34668.1 primosomal protein N' [bacterium BMS3Bbin06]
MLLCEIVFPQNLPFLTYSVPEPLKGTIKPGHLVTAPLRKREKKGIVLRLRTAVNASGLKEITGIADSTPLLPLPLISLLEWAAGYYITNHGLMLKSMLSDVLISPPGKTRPCNPVISGYDTDENTEDTEEIIANIKALTNEGRFGVFLLQPADQYSQLQVIRGLLSEGVSALILSPEISYAERIYTVINRRHRGKTAILHGRMKRSERYDTLKGLLNGNYSILTGTRSAVFAPMKPKILIVTHEHNHSYKQEESPRYHARDVAVMRAMLEDIPVLLMSPTPSLESLHNCRRNRYRLIKTGTRPNPPVVRVLDLKKTVSPVPFLSQRVINSLKAVTGDGAGKKAMIIIQRKGYAMLRCDECGHIEECPDCMIPLVYHKKKGLLCHYCKFSKPLPRSCPHCKGYNLNPFGAGVERIQEYLDNLFESGVKPREITLDASRGRSKGGGESTNLTSTRSPAGDRYLIVGTLSRRGLYFRSLDLIAFLNPDIILNLPDFRSSERLFQEVVSVSDFLLPGGEIILQTEVPWHPVFRYLKKWDYLGFAGDELLKRREASAPPFTKMIAVYIYKKRESDSDRDDIEAAVDGVGNREDVHGPVRTLPRLRGYEACYQVVLKGKTMKIPREKALYLKDRLTEGGFTLRFDVDPVFL